MADTSIIHGQTVVITAGTEVALGTSAPRLEKFFLYVKALVANTGVIYVGTNPVTSGTGFELLPGDQVIFQVFDIAEIYIDASVDGDGVSFIGG